MMVYDTQHKRLAIFGRQATPEFWDEQWNKNELLKRIKSGNTYHFLKKITQRYVPRGGHILEGGCGTGQVVYALGTWGYEAFGVDFAPATVEMVTSLVPDLRISLGDVRHLNFPEASFDGYWSLGVIEHFWDGYGGIVEEAHRILKPGGFLFLSFPVMSPLRKLKARLGLYPRLDSSSVHDPFYEFVLDADEVARSVEPLGFQLVHREAYDALKGVKDEFSIGKAAFQRLYQARNPVARIFRFAFTILFARLTGHMALLVFKKV